MGDKRKSLPIGGVFDTRIKITSEGKIICYECEKKMSFGLANDFDPMVIHAFCKKCNYLVVRDWNGEVSVHKISPKEIKNGRIKYMRSGNITLFKSRRKNNCC